MGTKKGRIYGKGAPFKGAPQRFGGTVAPNCPPWIRHCCQRTYNHFQTKTPCHFVTQSIKITSHVHLRLEKQKIKVYFAARGIALLWLFFHLNCSVSGHGRRKDFFQGEAIGHFSKNFSRERQKR